MAKSDFERFVGKVKNSEPFPQKRTEKQMKKRNKIKMSKVD